MNGGISFNMDGPMIDGTWYNPQTGDSFTVRDSYFQDGQLIVQATDGRMFDYNIIQNYIKSDKPIPPQNKPVKAQAKTTKTPPASDQDMSGILPEDLALINGGAITDITEQPITRSITESSAENTLTEDQRFIKRLLAKASEPSVDFKISWNKFPERQLETLEDFMGIDLNLIADYYISKLDVNDIKENIAKQLVEFITKQRNKKDSDKAKK